MGIVAERLDYLWFLGYGLEDAIPNHSVLSKARARWGKEVFESFFMRIVLQCVQRGLVDGSKIHIDASFVKGHASLDGVQSGPPELIAALKAAYQAQESKLSETAMPPGYQAVNDRVISPTDPDTSLIRRGAGGAKLCYHHHRVVDDAQGVVTAVKTTPGSIVEQSQLETLIDQHQDNTNLPPQTVVADCQYGTVDNFIACQQRGIRSHMGDGQARRKQDEGIFPESAFTYRAEDNTYTCPAGQVMKAGPLHQQRGTWEYRLPPQHLRRLRPAPAMHPVQKRPHPAPPTTAGVIGPGPQPIPQLGGAAGPETAATAHGRQLCRRGQQPRLQAGPLAALVAPTDPRLDDRRRAKHPHPGQTRQRATRPGGGSVRGPPGPVPPSDTLVPLAYTVAPTNRPIL
jgi:hypothetical protein